MVGGKPALLFFLLWVFLALAAVFFHGKVFAENFGFIANAESEEYDDMDFDDEFENYTDELVFDPLSGYNRFMTKVNDKLYVWVLKPFAKGYGKIMPEPGRLAIVRCFNNILFPIRFVNNFLQFKFKRAGIEIARFGVNSTIGILGFTDPAGSWLNLEACREDFGQTLGHYGVGSGFHIVLPVIGPSNIRDSIGMIPDYFLNPIHYIDNQETIYGIRIFDKINYTSLHINDYESLKKDAVDFYILLRDVYEQNRKTLIKE